jgi:3-hydroxymyristoyl/3-hydroxydecanoyl-(acyl carrier protein) dehydratase
MNETRRPVIPVDAPYFAGHFPGDPLVPGVVILERVIEEISRRAGAPQWAERLEAVKFLAPLRPGDELSIDLESAADATTVRFECRSGVRSVAQGLIVLRARACR